MFQRRRKLQPHHRLRNLIWPNTGFRRSFSYLWHRIARLPGTPHEIAGGFAFGAATSFTPFVGGHLVGAAVLAWVTRTHIIASAIGTAIGNPWTFPFIWAWIYTLGSLILVRDGTRVKFLDLTPTYLWEHFWEVFVPMMVGGLPMAILVWVGCYFPLRFVVAAYQERRRQRRLRKLKQFRAQRGEVKA